MSDSRAVNAAAEAMTMTGTADLQTLARAAVKAARPFLRGEELKRCMDAAERLGATYPAERDEAPEERRANAADSDQWPFSEYLEDTYDG
jgi:hypothetical protein